MIILNDTLSSNCIWGVFKAVDMLACALDIIAVQLNAKNKKYLNPKYDPLPLNNGKLHTVLKRFV